MPNSGYEEETSMQQTSTGPLLRFAKVSAIHQGNVEVTGLNPPTGKHVTIVFESVPEPHFSHFKAALASRIFLKVKIPSPSLHFDIEEEGAPSGRTDSYFSVMTYAAAAGYHPEFLRELDEYLVTMQNYMRPLTDVGIILLDVIDKLGSVCYCRDRLAEINRDIRPSHAVGRIYVVDAIAGCKGCLDGLALMLNEVYSLGYSRGDVDLSRGRFVNSLRAVNARLASRLSEHLAWIRQITKYRDAVIHRVMLLTPVSSVKEIGQPEALAVQVPSQPVTIGSSQPSRINWTQAQIICQELIDKLEILIEIICSDLLDLLHSRSYIAT